MRTKHYMKISRLDMQLSLQGDPGDSTVASKLALSGHLSRYKKITKLDIMILLFHFYH
jgi:hypothetical protein